MPDVRSHAIATPAGRAYAPSMDARVFVTVFAAVGAALGVAMLAVGIISVATGAQWGWLLPGTATLAMVGVLVVVMRAAGARGR